MKSELLKLIEEDRYRYFGGGKRPLFYKMRMPALKYTTSLRKAQYHKEKNNMIRYLINEVKTRIYSSLYLIQIPTSTNIGRGLYISHNGSVIVNPEAVLGENINLSVGVTIGQTNRGTKKGSPTIGNHVWIGTNAVIVGKITIGNNVLIAPNAYVNRDVPSNTIVFGNPAQYKSDDEATLEYVHNIV